MAQSVVIVESPAKAKTIQKYLGPDYEIIASVGHIKNLPDNKLGVDVDGGFRPEYEVIKTKRDVIKRIKQSSKAASRVYLAPDPDREGEAIAWHIAEELGPREGVYRVLFNEITKNAIVRALEQPQQLNVNRYNSQQTRRILDRLVGYQLSPLLWKKVKQGLSAGRVQSVALKMVCDRERSILAFVPVEYWTVQAQLEGSAPPPFVARLHSVDGQKADLTNGEQAQRVRAAILSASITVKSVTRKQRQRRPAPPFITSRLQQEAVRKLRFTAKKTMMVAQSLYEGVDIGEAGPQGLITYMRTDSTRLSQESLDAVRAFVAQRYGEAYVPAGGPNVYKTRKGAQDAHEAIRPTNLEYEPEKIKGFLTPDQYRLYKLIWGRFLACQMAPALYDAVAVDLEAGPVMLRASGSTLVFAGFTAVYTEGRDPDPTGDEDEDGDGVTLPPLKEGEAIRCLAVDADQHFTEPPPRYTESTLIRDLEERGIGRPSTYALILSNIQEKEYVSRDKGRFFPSPLGMLVNDLLQENFPTIINEEFTAQLESRLDEIEEGRSDWQSILQDFNGRFQSRLEAAEVEMRNVKREGIETSFKCEKCGRGMVLKWGRNGQFLACSGYPECRNAKSVEVDPEGNIKPVEDNVPTDESCDKCGAQMLLKHGRFGKFLACSAFPGCKNTRPVPGEERKGRASEPLPSAEGLPPCEKCGSPLAWRRGRFGPFAACTGYPECKYIYRVPKAAGEDGAGKGRGRRGRRGKPGEDSADSAESSAGA